MAQVGGADVLNYEDHDDLVEVLKQMTGGMGPEWKRTVRPRCSFFRQGETGGPS
jgi:hypothetical protein